ncbi:MAG: peptide chain release factor aRF-1, partial [Candidatus Aenigmatarchaeota archaeon]
LVSVYVPVGYAIVEIIGQLRNEQSTAENIKSKTTRKNVVSALEKIMQHLKMYTKTPENGVAIFAGNTSEQEGAPDIQLWAIEPPEKIGNKLYWCDQTFVLDPLKEMIEEKEVYGLLAIDSAEATIAHLTGKKIVIIKHIESIVPGKTSKGGWSQARYSRIREGLLNDFLKEIGEFASKVFLEQKNLIGVIIGGPGPIKEEFLKDNYLHYEIQKKVLGTVDISYTDESGINELIERSKNILQQTQVAKEKEVLQKFFTELQKDSGLVVYGYEKVMDALDAGSVETVLITEDFDWVRAKTRCENCRIEEERNFKHGDRQYCSKCKSPMKITDEKDLVGFIEDHAESLGSKIRIISGNTQEGNQFKELDGIAAMLRYKM